jgi:hypothetical protein
MGREIKREYYSEIDKACRVLYKLELDIRADDVSISQFTAEERIFSKASQRAFWWKFTPDDRKFEQFTGRTLALKFMCENGNTTSYENWMTYPEPMRRQFHNKLQELTSKGFWKRRINPVCQSRCDRCEKTIVELKTCHKCDYGRYCSAKCQLDDEDTHQAVCYFLVTYLDWKREHGLEA